MFFSSPLPLPVSVFLPTQTVEEEGVKMLLVQLNVINSFPPLALNPAPAPAYFFSFSCPQIVEEEGAKKLLVDSWFGTRKMKASIRTAVSHVSNLIKGVTKGFRYKMRLVYAHFPINSSINGPGNVIEIRNFLGRRRCAAVPRSGLSVGYCVATPVVSRPREEEALGACI